MTDSNNTARINLRCTPEEKDYITHLSQHSYMTTTQLMVTSTLYPLKLPIVQDEIHNTKIREINELYNLIQYLDIPQRYKNVIIQEMNRIWQN